MKTLSSTTPNPTSRQQPGLGVLLILSGVLTACSPNYSNGSRVGVVQKFSEKGIAFKSWEGELMMGGVKQVKDEHGNITGAVANTFEFNADPSVVKDIQSAMESGKRVELFYHQWLVSPITIGDDHVVYKVKILD